MELPDLPGGDGDIVPENIRAMAAIYFAAQLEQLKFFQVADRLVELFQSGQLPLGGSSATTLLRRCPECLIAAERRQVYMRTLGLPGGDNIDGGVSGVSGVSDVSGVDGVGGVGGVGGDITPNTEFAGLWLRFLTATATSDPSAFRGAARDLATNLSLYGYGWTFAAAQQLVRQVDTAIAILNAPEIQAIFGAHSPWSVVETVAQSDLGGAPDISRLRTQAQSGATIIRWVAEHATDVADPSSTLTPGTTLLNAVDQWLAVSGIPDSTVDQQSQPVDCPPRA